MKKKKEDHVYSYSQLTSVGECPYMYYLERIEKVDQMSNGFAERGTLIHDLIDQWAKGVLTKEQMPLEYDRRYGNEVVTKFPQILAAKGYAQKAYESGLNYLTNFDEFAGYKILSAEEKFKIDLKLVDGTTRPFVGIIDMVLQDELTDELIICDHKSKSKSAFRKAENEMYRQQLLYATYIKDKFGKWPDRLMFNLFNENGLKPERPFDEEEYQKAIEWATQMVERIETYDMLDWLTTKDQDFFCQNICSARKECPNGAFTAKKS